MIIGMVIFNKKLGKSYIGWVRKNPGIHPSYHFCDFRSKMAYLGYKLKFWNFPEFSLSINRGCSHTVFSKSNLLIILNHD